MNKSPRQRQWKYRVSPHRILVWSGLMTPAALTMCLSPTLDSSLIVCTYGALSVWVMKIIQTAQQDKDN